jgi:hypothetical protein
LIPPDPEEPEEIEGMSGVDGDYEKLSGSCEFLIVSVGLLF